MEPISTIRFNILMQIYNDPIRSTGEFVGDTEPIQTDITELMGSFSYLRLNDILAKRTGEYKP